MMFSKTNITHIRGDDSAMIVALSSGHIFEAGDKVYFSLKTTPSDEVDILQIESTEFVAHNGVEKAAVMIEIKHDDTIDLVLGKYYYDILIKWADGTYVTVIPPTQFKLVPGGSHDGLL